MINLKDCKTLEEYCEKAIQYYKDKGIHILHYMHNCCFINRVMLTHLKKQSSGICMVTYSDIYKDAHGFGPRFNFLEYTIEKLEQMIDDVSDEAKEIADI